MVHFNLHLDEACPHHGHAVIVTFVLMGKITIPFPLHLASFRQTRLTFSSIVLIFSVVRAGVGMVGMSSGLLPDCGHVLRLVTLSQTPERRGTHGGQLTALTIRTTY